jgi:hypothetical protein
MALPKPLPAIPGQAGKKEHDYGSLVAASIQRLDLAPYGVMIAELG